MSGAEQFNIAHANKLAKGLSLKIALSVKEIEEATGLGHTQTYKEIMSGRLRTYKVGSRRFSTPEWLCEWQAARVAETEQAAGA